jgi:hypothetical protein
MFSEATNVSVPDKLQEGNGGKDVDEAKMGLEEAEMGLGDARPTRKKKDPRVA